MTCDVEADSCVCEVEEGLELAEELLSQNGVEGLPGDEALFEKDFAHELPRRRSDPMRKPPLPPGVEQPLASQEGAQGQPGRGRIERNHPSFGEMNAMGRSEIFGQLEHAIGAGTIERAEEITERRSSQPTGKLHAVRLIEPGAYGQVSSREGGRDDCAYFMMPARSAGFCAGSRC